MFRKFFRNFSTDPFKFMEKLEKPITDLHSKLTLNYPFKSATPITKTIINSSIFIYCLWQYVPYKYMFRHFQVSEYTIQRGYLHTVFTGSISHQDVGHLVPDVLSYFLFGKLIEKKFGSRKTFYLILSASLGSIAAIALFEKVFTNDVALITPKCNGSVPAIALATATLVRCPSTYLNPFGLKHSLKNEFFMMPMIVPVSLFFMLEYYKSQYGSVEYLCNF